MELNLDKLAKIVNGKLEGEDKKIAGIHINSNDIQQGDLFIPTIGEKSDGHDFIQDAIDKGAVAAIVSKPIKTSIPTILVNDTLDALRLIAKNHFDSLKKKPKVFAITGSVGKTTTKDLLVAILEHDNKVVYSEKNFNTPYSLPFTVLKTTEDTDCLVLELSATSYDDMEFYINMVKFDYALVTKIGTAHLDGFGSRENIFKAKSHIYDGLNEGGVAFLNNYDDSAHKFVIPDSVEKYYIDPEREVLNITEDKFGYYTFDLEENSHVQLKIPSHPVFLDAVFAIAMARHYGVDNRSINHSLNETIRVSEHRMSRKEIGGVVIIDDSYNANPTSMIESINFALSRKAARPHKKLKLVLGEMAELGNESIFYHKHIGDFLQYKNFDELLLVGKMAGYIASRNEGSRHFKDNIELSKYLSESVTDQDIILFKGSNSNKLFDVADQLASELKRKEVKEDSSTFTQGNI